MEFAAKQLEKYGWKQGQGLGKKRSGISRAIKVALKRDTAGVGYDPSSEFTCQWWSAAFDKAVSRVSVQDTKDGVILQSEGTHFLSPTSKQQQYDQHQSELIYGRFTKAAKSLEVEEMVLRHSSQAVGEEGSEEVLQKRGSFHGTHQTVQAMSDEQLLKACEGRTAHKAARHGLRLSGKMKRIAKQDSALAAALQPGKGEIPPKTQEKVQGHFGPRKQTCKNGQVEVAGQSQHKAKRRKL